MLRQLEAVEHQIDVYDAYKLVTSMVKTIIWNADKIKNSAMTDKKLTPMKVTC